MKSVRFSRLSSGFVFATALIVSAGALAQLAPAQTVPIFGKPVTYDSGGNFAGVVAVADVNGDGRPDVVVGNGGIPTVSVLLGNGDGTLQAPVSYYLGEEAVSVSIVDVNGDGRPDMIVATDFEVGNPNSGAVSVLLGNGDGTFQPAVSYSSGGYGAISLAVADENGDGHLDLIVANVCQSSPCDYHYDYGSVGVLLGNGDGTFQPAVVSSISVGDVHSTALADLNGDGTPDLVVAGVSRECFWATVTELSSLSSAITPAVLPR